MCKLHVGKSLYKTREPLDMRLIKKIQIVEHKGWTQNTNSRLRVVLENVMRF
jgi:hypothetical protein